jgi:hypothetical protein
VDIEIQQEQRQEVQEVPLKKSWHEKCAERFIAEWTYRNRQLLLWGIVDNENED